MSVVMGVHGIDTPTAIRRVNDVLEGPVVDILCQVVPELKALPRTEAYERTLDDIDLLQRCFQAFRRERQRFRTLLVDDRQRPVTEDGAPLSCGRTLDEVVAMVVRTAAKRYFRRRHDPDAAAHKAIAPRLRQGIHDKGFAHRAAAALAKSDTRATAKTKPTRSRADDLYDAIKEHLLHDWQVPMVPTYAEMTPTLLRSLGAKLLEVRDLDHLKKIADDPAEAAKLFDMATLGQTTAAQDVAPPAPVVAGPARRDERARLSDVLSADGKSLRPEAFTDALLKPELRACVKEADLLLRNREILQRVGAVPAKLLVAELGLRVDQLAVVLLTAHEKIGPQVFGRIFGQPGDAELVMRITQRARLAGLSQQTPLKQCAAFVGELFSRFGG